MKAWMGWTAAAAVALVLSTSAGFACDQHAQAAEGKDAKAGTAPGETKGCDMPCCAKKAVAGAKPAAAVAPAVAAHDGGTSCDTPCDAGKTADGKACPKKAAAAAKAEPAHDAPKAEPAVNSGAGR